MTMADRRRRPAEWKLRELAAELAHRRHLEALRLDGDRRAQRDDLRRRLADFGRSRTRIEEVPF